MNSPYKGKFRVSQEFKGSAHDGLDLVGIDSKNIYSTIDGVVEFAGWESALNHKKGFGRYVRIKKNNSIDKYYFGHLSSIKVKKGQAVKKGDLLGVEGSTGYSTGSHCHYCIRTNASHAQVKDVCAISGIPNALGTYDDGYAAKLAAKKKTVSELAQEVLDGKWGNGAERKQKLTDAGYDYNAVQQEVNRLVAPAKKSNEEIAREVIKGLWGNGAERKEKLRAAGYDPNAIQKIVNTLV